MGDCLGILLVPFASRVRQLRHASLYCSWSHRVPASDVCRQRCLVCDRGLHSEPAGPEFESPSDEIAVLWGSPLGKSLRHRESVVDALLAPQNLKCRGRTRTRTDLSVQRILSRLQPVTHVTR